MELDLIEQIKVDGVRRGQRNQSVDGAQKSKGSRFCLPCKVWFWKEGRKCIIIVSAFESLLGIVFDFLYYADKTIKLCNVHA